MSSYVTFARPPHPLPPWLCLASFLLLAADARCSGDDIDCRAEPLGAVNAFAEGDVASPLVCSGRVAAVESTGVEDQIRYVVRDSTGREWRLDIAVAGIPLPLSSGQWIEARVEWIGGFPPASAFVISDENGLLAAGAADQALGAHVLKAGPPGFTLAWRPTGCSSRPHGECLESVHNAWLDVARGDEQAHLWNGQTGRLGNWRVTCLTAEKITYSPRCADAGQHQVSWFIERLPAEEPKE